MLSYITKRANIQITEGVNTFSNKVVVIQLFSHVWLFLTPGTAARQASLSLTTFWSLLKFKFIESAMPSSHLIHVVHFSCLQSFPAPGSFLMSQLFTSGGQSIGVSASASVLLLWQCVISSVLSRSNKNLKWRRLKPSDRLCHSSRTDRVSTLGQISVTALCYSSVLFRK